MGLLPGARACKLIPLVLLVMLLIQESLPLGGVGRQRNPTLRYLSRKSISSVAADA
jgi:hypothetical protein